jgi:hypothetical protein
MSNSFLAKKVSALKKWQKIAILFCFLILACFINAPLFFTIINDEYPYIDGHITEKTADGKTSEWVAVEGQLPTNNLTFVFRNGELKSSLMVNPEYKYFSFYRKPTGNIIFQGESCPITEGNIYYIQPPSRTRIDNPHSWHGSLGFHCDQVKNGHSIEGFLDLR